MYSRNIRSIVSVVRSTDSTYYRRIESTGSWSIGSIVSTGSRNIRIYIPVLKLVVGALGAL